MAKLYCERCGKLVPQHGQLKPCLKCGGLEFTTRPEFDRALTWNDKRLMKTLQIKVDPPKPDQA